MDENIDYLKMPERENLKADTLFTKFVESKYKELMYNVNTYGQEDLFQKESRLRDKIKLQDKIILDSALNIISEKGMKGIMDEIFSEERSFAVNEIKGSEEVVIESLQELQAQLNPNLIEEIMNLNQSVNPK
jgi:hypothetical protein